MKNSKESMQNSLEKKSEWPKEYRKGQGHAKIMTIRTLKGTLPKRFQDKTFTNFNTDNNAEEFASCRKYSKDFMERLKDGKGLFITGKVGSGKTHLAAAIIDYIARILKNKKRMRLIFTTAVNLIAEIKYSFDSNDTEETVKKYEECDLLVIDDLGPERMTDWTNELFYKIIDSRYSNMRPMIITTNLTNKEIKGKLSERVVSRIYECCKGIQMKGNDYRSG